MGDSSLALRMAGGGCGYRPSFRDDTVKNGLFCGYRPIPRDDVDTSGVETGSVRHALPANVPSAAFCWGWEWKCVESRRGEPASQAPPGHIPGFRPSRTSGKSAFCGGLLGVGVEVRKEPPWRTGLPGPSRAHPRIPSFTHFQPMRLLRRSVGGGSGSA